jgi:hypothetical protein
VSFLLALVANACLAGIVLVSVMLASWWGELAGIAPGFDKTSLSGLMAFPLFMGVRWIAIAVLLGIIAWRATLGFLPEGRWARLGVVLGVHGVLGLVSWTGFEAIARGLQNDDFGPQRWALPLGVLLPLPALALLAWGINREFLERHTRTAVLLGAALVLVHLLPYRARLQDMQRVAAARVET